MFIVRYDNAFPNAQVKPKKKLTVAKKMTENQTDEARMGGKDSMGENVLNENKPGDMGGKDEINDNKIVADLMDTEKVDATELDISSNNANL